MGQSRAETFSICSPSQHYDPEERVTYRLVFKSAIAHTLFNLVCIKQVISVVVKKGSNNSKFTRILEFIFKGKGEC